MMIFLSKIDRQMEFYKIEAFVQAKRRKGKFFFFKETENDDFNVRNWINRIYSTWLFQP